MNLWWGWLKIWWGESAGELELSTFLASRGGILPISPARKTLSSGGRDFRKLFCLGEEGVVKCIAYSLEKGFTWKDWLRGAKKLYSNVMKFSPDSPVIIDVNWCLSLLGLPDFDDIMINPNSDDIM